MILERKPEQFKDDRKKWDIYFDIDLGNINNDTCFIVKFSKHPKRIEKEDIEKLKQDLKDLGKFRIIKEGRRFLEK